LEEVGSSPSGNTGSQGTLIERGEHIEKRTFWVWTQGACCRFRFCPVVACVTLQINRALNVRHIRDSANQITVTFVKSIVRGGIHVSKATILI